MPDREPKGLKTAIQMNAARAGFNNRPRQIRSMSVENTRDLRWLVHRLAAPLDLACRVTDTYRYRFQRNIETGILLFDRLLHGHSPSKVY
jgi:hypothetical protein